MTSDLVFQSPGGKDVTSSLKIAEVFGRRHDNVLADIKSLSCSAEFSLLNFKESNYESRGKMYPMYLITKDGFSFLAMGYTGEKAAQFKEKFIAEFNKREALLKNDDYILMRSQEILQKRISSLETKLLQAVSKIELDSPKVLFADSVGASNSLILVRELAIILAQNGVNIGEKRLYEWLRSNGYVISRSGSDKNMPTQKSLNLGLMRIKEGSRMDGNKEPVLTKTTGITGKGQQYFIDKFLNQQKRA